MIFPGDFFRKRVERIKYVDQSITTNYVLVLISVKRNIDMINKGTSKKTRKKL